MSINSIKLTILKTKSIELLNEMNGQIEFIEAEFEDEIHRAEEIIGVIIKTIDVLKKIVHKYKFKSRNEEIHFFKEIKPQFTSKLYYYNTILRIETQKPIGANEVLKSYYQLEQSRIKAFFDNNLDFYKYYRFRNNYLDEKYFLRGNFDIKNNLVDFFIELDPKFSTSHDNKVANIIANDLLLIYIDKKIIELDVLDNRVNIQQRSKVNWTGSKASLIELLYAVYKSNNFNNGNMGFNEIITEFENFLNVNLGNYYKTINDIKNRKNGRTKFLQYLNDNLNQYFFESDE